MSAALYERRETFTSGHWFGVKVEHAWGSRDGGYTIYVGKGADRSGGWQPLPVPVYDYALAELTTRDLFLSLVGEARREARLYERRHADALYPRTEAA